MLFKLSLNPLKMIWCYVIHQIYTNLFDSAKLRSQFRLNFLWQMLLKQFDRNSLIKFEDKFKHLHTCKLAEDDMIRRLFDVVLNYVCIYTPINCKQLLIFELRVILIKDYCQVTRMNNKLQQHYPSCNFKAKVPCAQGFDRVNWICQSISFGSD